MDANLIHDIIFYIMYAVLALALVVIVERFIYFAHTRRQAAQLAEALQRGSMRQSDLQSNSSLPARVAGPVLDLADRGASQNETEDLIDAQYMSSKASMSRGLWFLETTVTASPLLGLLGTIMGIVETFKELSASGISDASKVSEGMGTALYATGLDITIALICLIANNFLLSRMDRINDLLKIALVRAAGAGHAKGRSGAWAEQQRHG